MAILTALVCTVNVSLHFWCSLIHKQVDFVSQIMKVKLAAQTFSASVSKALEFVSKLELPQFGGCDATAKFISMVDR